MTSKQDPVDLDAYTMMLHAAQSGMTFEEYEMRVVRVARKKIRKLGEGLVKDD